MVVLKGAGAIIAAEHHSLAIIDAGNAGMASTAGWAMSCPASSAHCSDEVYPVYDAACVGCVAHGAAADLLAARYGSRHVGDRLLLRCGVLLTLMAD